MTRKKNKKKKQKSSRFVDLRASGLFPQLSPRCACTAAPWTPPARPMAAAASASPPRTCQVAHAHSRVPSQPSSSGTISVSVSHELASLQASCGSDKGAGTACARIETAPEGNITPSRVPSRPPADPLESPLAATTAKA
eukprot:6058260-Pyramimonas_sp.AAC.2